MSEGYNDNLRRRRRSQPQDITNQPAGSGDSGSGDSRIVPASDNRDSSADPRNGASAARIPEQGREDPASVLGQDSRVPAEARRMSASPYGSVNSAAARRPGTRQVQQDPRRPAARGGNPQQSRNTARGANASRLSVGYAPGRMNIHNGRPDTAGERNGARPYPENRTPSHTRQATPGNAIYGLNGRRMEREGRKKKPLIILAVLAAVALVVFVVWKVLPGDVVNSILGRTREETTDPTSGQEETEDPALSGDISADQQKDAAPEDPALTADASDVKGSGPSQPDEETQGGNTSTKEISEETLTTDGAEDPEAEGHVPEEDAEDPEAEDDIPEEDGEDPEADGDMPEEGMEDPEAEGEALPSAEAEMAPPEEPVSVETVDADAVDDGGQAEETTGTEAETAPVLTAEAAPGANPDILTTKVYSGKNRKKEYSRLAKEQIHMQPGWDYTKHKLGVLTFRGNAFRTNGAVGTVAAANELEEIWKLQTGSLRGVSQTYYGSGWPGQPAIIWWPKEIRQMSTIDEDKKSIKNMKEVIVPVQDGTIRLLNLEDGTITRNSIKVGYPMTGTPSLHPGGFPYMTAGQMARKLKNKQGKIGLRQYNMYNLNELTPLIDGLDGKLHRAPNNIGSFETSALIDRKSDTLITAGTNGMLYLIRLNGELDFNLGLFTYKPETIVAVCTKKKEKAAQTAVESSLAMYDKYVYYADMGGVLRCVDTDFLTPVWAVETEDSVMAAVALDQRNAESLDLYTANMLNNRKKGNAQIRRYNALNGSLIWCTEIGVQKDTKNKTASGCKASPVIGENKLSDLVYFTVTGLNDDGRETLNVPEDTKAALVALEKESGRIRWAYALSDRSDSSPIAVYDEAGNGRIIQCIWDGTVVMVDGLSGQLVHSITLKGNIEASPAAFDDIMVVGTTGKGTESIFGVKIK